MPYAMKALSCDPASDHCHTPFGAKTATYVDTFMDAIRAERHRLFHDLESNRAVQAHAAH